MIDSRGGWAVCGKTSGILTFPGPCPQTSSLPNVTIDINVMPLLSGFLHFPYILLHRYVKRSSELGLIFHLYHLFFVFIILLQMRSWVLLTVLFWNHLNYNRLHMEKFFTKINLLEFMSYLMIILTLNHIFLNYDLISVTFIWWLQSRLSQFSF